MKYSIFLIFLYEIKVWLYITGENMIFGIFGSLYHLY